MKEHKMTEFNFDREKLAIYQETIAIVNNNQDYSNKDFITSAIKLACKNLNLTTNHEEDFYLLYFPNKLVDFFSYHCLHLNSSLANDIATEIASSSAILANKSVSKRISLALNILVKNLAKNPWIIAEYLETHCNCNSFKPSFMVTDFVIAKYSYLFANNIWFSIFDTSLDYNFYSKRLILAKIISQLLPIIAYDKSINHYNSYQFIDKELTKINNFSRFKYQLKNKINDFTTKICNNCNNQQNYQTEDESAHKVRNSKNHKTQWQKSTASNTNTNLNNDIVLRLKELTRKLPFIRLYYNSKN
jgi:rpsU-divergently transcribed protein